LREIISSSKGLTLIEILASLTIFGIISISLLSFFTQAYQFTNSNENKTVAVNVARNALMYMQKQNFIEVRADFEEKNIKEYRIFICENPTTHKREYLRTVNQSVENCENITINNVPYQVEITYNPDGYDKDTDRSYIIPIKITVNWDSDGHEKETELKGVINSEDIR
jgi:prepilin-type N-terminal cleavage/methylation domain-containing protein